MDTVVKGAPVQRRRFQEITKLGSGTYGEVFSAYDCKQKCKVAIKRFKKLNTSDMGMSTAALREISVLKGLPPHSNICQLLDVVDTKDFPHNDVLLVMELENSDLEKWIQDSKPTLQDAITITYQLLLGCLFLHENFIMHRDLKPDNILINGATMKIKITDFGQARPFGLTPQKYTLGVQALFYRAPELLLGCSQYSEKIDLWSIGCIFAEILGHGEPIFGTPDATAISQLHKIFQIQGTPNDDRWSSLCTMPWYRKDFPSWTPVKWDAAIARGVPVHDEEAHLLRMLLSLDPDARATCVKALDSYLFSGMPKQF